MINILFKDINILINNKRIQQLIIISDNINEYPLPPPPLIQQSEIVNIDKSYYFFKVFKYNTLE